MNYESEYKERKINTERKKCKYKKLNYSLWIFVGLVSARPLSFLVIWQSYFSTLSLGCNFLWCCYTFPILYLESQLYVRCRNVHSSLEEEFFHKYWAFFSLSSVLLVFSSSNHISAHLLFWHATQWIFISLIFLFSSQVIFCILFSLFVLWLFPYHHTVEIYFTMKLKPEALLR